MENLIEELTKVNPSNLSKEGLKLFKDIMKIADERDELKANNKELEEKQKSYNTAYNLGKAFENNKWKSKVEEKIEEYKKMLKSCNRFSDVDRIKAINERILAYKELLEE